MHATGASTPVDGLREALLDAAAELAGADGADGGSPPGRPDAITLERPPQADFGDYATNAALLLAPSLGVPPREVAERLGAELERRLGEGLQRYRGRGAGLSEPVPRRFVAARRAGARARRG